MRKKILPPPVIIREDTAQLMMNRLRPVGYWLQECHEFAEENKKAPEVGEILDAAMREYAEELKAADLPVFTKR